MFAVLGSGLLCAETFDVTYSRRTIYIAGTIAQASSASSGMLYAYIFDAPTRAQWHRNSTMKRFTRYEKPSMKPMVNKATDEGITGEAIIG